MSLKARPGLWPPIGERILVRDSNKDPWHETISAGGGYYFADEYGPPLFEVKEWKPLKEENQG